MQVIHYEVHPEKWGKQKPREPFSVALLSDLHNASFDRQGRAILKALRETSPRFILSAGDMVTAKNGRGGYMEAARLIREMTGICPVYLSQGNHELRMKEFPERYDDMYERYMDEVRKAGAVLLDNDTTRLETAGLPIALSAISVPYPCYKRRGRATLSEEEIQETLGKADRDAFQVLLAHYPDFFPVYCNWGADLVLSGHVHGGIVRLPLLGGVFGSTYRLFPEFTRGRYFRGNQEMVLSAGLGSHTIPVRIGNPTQLVILDFE